MTDKRVKYYEASDLSVGFYLPRLKEVVDSALPSSIDDINTVMELVNIIKFIEAGIYDKRWSKAFQSKVKDSKARFYKVVSEYFQKITPKMLPAIISQLDNDYVDDFIDQFEKFNVGSRVTAADFKKLLDDHPIPYWRLGSSKYLVKTYPEVLKSIFLSNPRNFEIFLNNFTSTRVEKTFVPDTINKDEMLQLCNDYIDSNDANINYLRIIRNPIKGIEQHMNIDAKARLKAKKRSKQLEDGLFKGRVESGFSVNMAVLSSRATYEKELATSKPTDLIALIDGEWIEKYHDIPTLLNNVLYLYDFFSPDLISELPSFPKRELGVFEAHMGVDTSSSYKIGQYFTVKQQFATMKLRALSELLAKYSIILEDLIDWFFTTYSKDEFGIKWLPLDMPSREESQANQTATLLRIEEHIRKQYQALVSNGSIDAELVQISNTPSFNELNSHTNDKYVYLFDSNDAQAILNLLFSDQSSLTYINDKLKGRHFVDLILSNKVRYTDLKDYQKQKVQYLIDQDVVIRGKDNFLQFKNLIEIKIFRKLYEVGVIGYYHISDSERAEIDSMIKQERVTFGSTLYSTQEQDYLNFILNNSAFDNSWAIRNNYQHGSPVYDNPDHYVFDNLIVKLMLLNHVIKINDELTLQKISSGGQAAYCEIVEWPQ